MTKKCIHRILLPLLFVSALSLSLSCVEMKDPIDDQQIKNLQGKWEETFRWSNLYNTYYVSKGKQRTGKLKTSTLSFAGENFFVKINPPERKIISAPDTIYVGYSSDTLFTGSFEIRRDTIIFDVNELSESYLFRFELSKNNLRLISAAEIDSARLLSGKIKYFLWANSINKFEGTFVKN